LESILSLPPLETSSPTTSQPRTGWLRKPDPDIWAAALEEILALTPEERKAISETAKDRATNLFGMAAMAKSLEDVLDDAVKMGPVRSDEVFGVWWKVAVMLLGFLIAYGYSSKGVHVN
jgi:alpha-1,3/alpha-1,6-mannosyltransferase